LISNTIYYHYQKILQQKRKNFRLNFSAIYQPYKINQINL